MAGPPSSSPRFFSPLNMGFSVLKHLPSRFPHPTPHPGPFLFVRGRGLCANHLDLLSIPPWFLCPLCDSFSLFFFRPQIEARLLCTKARSGAHLAANVNPSPPLRARQLLSLLLPARRQYHHAHREGSLLWSAAFYFCSLSHLARLVKKAPRFFLSARLIKGVVTLKELVWA